MSPEEVRRRIAEVEAKRLTELDLSNEFWIIGDENRLREIPPEVFELEWLETLRLSWNHLTSLPESISRLQNLSQLDLSCNQLSSLPESITRLQNLSQLDLKYNQLSSLPESFGNLQNLSQLDLNDNQLSSLPESFVNLQNLSQLDLSSNQLSSLPESFGSLQNLSQLDLSGNGLSSLPEFFDNLQNLSQLDLSNNRLSSLPESFDNLKNLSELNLSNNQLSSLPESFGRLKNLSQLDLNNNQLRSLPEFFDNLQNLSRLYLNNNQLMSLPKFFDNLQNLSELYLNNNQLRSLPEFFGNLQNLSEFYLNNNQLSSLPESISRLLNLASLDFTGNPLEEPPIEIANRSIEAIREYFRQKQEVGVDTLYEAKLLIVGEGEAGKTSLMKKIIDRNYQVPQSEPSTHGIDVKEFHFELDNGADFRVNIWDFGGQEIYHQTHQFFLTKRSLYALVADSRKEQPQLDYWLHIVELLSDNSPLMIIKNEKDNRAVDLGDESQLRGRFDNLKDTRRTNLAENRGLSAIIESIIFFIKSLPHIGSKLPKTWTKVREALEQQGKNYISLTEYFDICENNGFTQDKDKLQLSQFLHDIGVILHFQDDKASPLYDTVILKPEWGTDAVYKILKTEDNPVKDNLGQFTYNDLENIWCEPQYANKHRELLELMKRFKLCYELPDKPRNYIALQLLDKNQPTYDWDDTDNLRLRYEYEFMPKGIITRFIVDMHRYIVEPKVWRSGVLLQRDNTYAEVIETYNRKEIKIRLSGANKRGFLEIITDKLDEIHGSYHRLKVKKLIPCNCPACKNSQNPYFYEFNKLRERIANRKQTIECDNPPYHEVNVLGLIDDIIGRQQFIRQEVSRAKESGKGNDISIVINQGDMQMEDKSNKQIHFGSGDNVGRDKNTTNIHNSQNLTQAAKDIKELLDQLDKEYNNPMMVGAKAIEEISNNPTLKQRFVNALKEGGTEALNQLIDHPAVSIVLAAGQGFMDA